MWKLRVSIKALVYIEIIALLVFMFGLFSAMLRIIVYPHLVMGLAAVMSFALLMLIFNFFWLSSFNKDYPWMYRLWVFEQTLALYLWGCWAFYSTVLGGSLAVFLPIAFVITKIVLVRMYREKQQEATAIQRMIEQARQV